ncbi:MAG TPA: HAMP domain-containing sensor histidine kinase [Solirubrobacterales bacterium]|nr:HAMP domain-containing sensor histidine kinase [Solirubrobacterales bacterium]
MASAPAARSGRRAALRRLPLNSVRNRLVLLFFAITVAAVGFVYLYVVPQLRSSLTAEKLHRLEAAAADQGPRMARAMEHGISQGRLRRLVRDVAQQTESRVTLIGIRPDSSQPAFVVSDSEFERDAVQPRYVAAANTANTGMASSAVELVGGQRVGQTAIPLSARGEARWVAVLSDSLEEVDDNVALIRRQILIAGAIAIACALLAGYLAARAHSRRLRRLEEAADQIAGGNFSVPIPVTSSDEVGQLAMTFNEMQQRLARLDSARKEFIANASHELRTPIFSLGGFVELLEHEEPDEASRDEFVRTMREQVERLTKLTADLLDLSKLDADAIEIKAEPVQLGTLGEQVGSEFRPLADRHGSRLDVNAERDGAVALADPDRVAQIMRILLDNALTHTPEGTAITVTTRSLDGTAELIISDDGPGIDPRSRGRVFERFYTGDSVGGSGLGLAIARELARRMDGELAVSSRRGRTDFVLELPAFAPPPSAGQSSSSRVTA